MRQLQVGLDSVLHHVTSSGAAKPAAAEPSGQLPVRPSALKQKRSYEPQSGVAVIPGLEPSVVTAARAAGIGDAQLRRMGALAAKPTALTNGNTEQRAGPLSESEESDKGEELAQGSEEPMPTDPVGKAVVQMSKILAKMHAAKKSDLDEILTEGAALESSVPAASGGKSKAAAYLNSGRPSGAHRLLRTAPERGLLKRPVCTWCPSIPSQRSVVARASIAPARDARAGKVELAGSGGFGLPSRRSPSLWKPKRD